MQDAVSITPALCVTHYTGTMSALLALGLFPAEVFPTLPKRTNAAWLDHAGRLMAADPSKSGYLTSPRHSVLCWVKRLKGGTFEVGVQHTREQQQAAIQARAMRPHL
jgi:hypothetical protein